MESTVFLHDLAIVLLAAGFAAIVCHRLKQPKMLGYILAGLLIGPHTPPFSFIRDETTIRTLADLGVIFLMVSLGLEFNLRHFRRVGSQAGLSAVLDVGIMLWLGYLVGHQLGWTPLESLFLGGIVCDSSTTILARSLKETGRGHTSFSGYIIGVTVVEDVLAVALIAVLTGLAVTGTVNAGMVAGSLWALILFLGSVIVVGLLTVPRLLNYLSRLDDDEVIILPLVGLCFGISLLAVRMGLSMALGAVLIGAIASESRVLDRAGRLVDPLRHVFSSVFFVAIGLMLDPTMLLRYGGPILLVTAAVVIGKFVNNTISAILTGHDLPTALRAGAGLAQIAEFAFVIAALGLTLGVTRESIYQIGVSAAILTTIINPYFMRLIDRLADVVDRSERCRRWGVGFQLYGEWADRVRRPRMNVVIRKAIRRSFVIMLVNTVLILAAIACARYVSSQIQGLMPALAARPGLVSAVCWLAAMLVCLPLFVATLRKINALGMIFAEMGLPISMTVSWARHMRTFIANAILTAGSVALLLLTFVASSTIFPSREVLILLMGATIAIAWWRWPRMIRIYAQAQSALESVFATHPNAESTPRPSVPGTPDPLALDVNSARIKDHSPIVGRSLASIGLRSRTGATVVGIERGKNRLVNPGPDEILTPGDWVFLLGTPIQVIAARELLSGKDESPSSPKPPADGHPTVGPFDGSESAP